MTRALLSKYLEQLDNLKLVARESNVRLIRGDDDLFKAHANLFVKSYLMTLCSVLEAYLKDEVLDFVSELNGLLAELRLTKNVFAWGLLPDSDEYYKKVVGTDAVAQLSLEINAQKVDDRISGNIDRTIKTFRRCGVQLEACEKFQQHKGTVANIVLKRNAVVHHNNDAEDFSFGDIIAWADAIESYIGGISEYMMNVRSQTALNLERVKRDGERVK